MDDPGHTTADASDEPRRVRLDERAIRALAHPLRTRLLSRLRSHGPATATTLAHELDTNTGATSYHLRKLADVGLVEETDEGTGRQRWWRAAHDMHSWSPADVVGNPDAEAAAQWLQGEYLRHFIELAQAWAAEQADWPMEWRDASGGSDYLLRLTPEALKRMQQEIYDVVERYRVQPEAEPAATERVLFYMHVFPEPGQKDGDAR